MLHPLITRIRQYIESHDLMSYGNKYLLALSGGGDSMALFYVLDELGYDFECAHCNFHLRGEESDRDESFCKHQCEIKNKPFHIAHFSTEEYAVAHHISIEMAARKLRYNYFDKLCLDIGAKAVIVAHHKNDSVETMLLNLIRGTGIQGLLGISPKRGHVVRPMLCVRRDEIEQFLHDYAIPYVTDSSNQIDNVVRNRIRLDILPEMKKINPSVIDSMAETASRLQQVDFVFEKAMLEKMESAIISSESAFDVFNLDKIDDEYMLFYLLKDKGFTPASIKTMYTNIRTTHQGAYFKSDTHEALIDRGKLLIQPITSSLRTLKIPELGNYVVDEQFKLLVEQVERKLLKINRSKEFAFFDSDKVCFPLYLRPTRKGDRFHPYGMKGSKLVSDFLTDEKMNIFEKRRQYVLTDAYEHIIWVVGKRPDDNYKVTDNTKNVIIINWKKS